MEYKKPVLTFEEQIDLLTSRGLTITDKGFALTTLKNISYYRLSAYMLPFQDKSQIGNHIYKSNTDFKDILNLYNFDSDLRVLLFTAIEKIEIAVRTKIIYHLSHIYEPHWYLNEKLFSKSDFHKQLMGEIKNIFENSKETFICHYRKKYNNPYLPPSWMVLEVLSFGQLSKIYFYLNKKNDKRIISNDFRIHADIFGSWLHCISYIRNLCAHHSRLWNKYLAIKPIFPKKTIDLWINSAIPYPNKIYGSIVIIKYLLNTINPHNDFSEKLKFLLTGYNHIDLFALGFPKEWFNDDFWKY
ncbi:MAG: Abi family protein [Ignavibacteriae bacterium]|nr:Abi family protein [Ignavibacteriota bacterium]